MKKYERPNIVVIETTLEDICVVSTIEENVNFENESFVDEDF